MDQCLRHKPLTKLVRWIFGHFTRILLAISFLLIVYVQYYIIQEDIGMRARKYRLSSGGHHTVPMLRSDPWSVDPGVCKTEFYPKITDNVSYTPYENIPLPYRQDGGGPYVNLLDVPSPSFLENYKSFCWREELVTPTPYKLQSSLRPALEEEWAHRLTAGISWRMRCLPYFYIAGFPKCGTSDLFQHLNLHPLVANISRKEVHYWTKRRVEVRKGKPFFQHMCFYVDVFDKAAMEVDACMEPGQIYPTGFHPKVIGEASPSTLWWTNDWQLLPENHNASIETGPVYHPGHYIHHVTPRAKFIVMMRNPIDVAYSWYMFKGGRDVNEFHNLTVHAVNILKECLERRSMWSCVNDLSLEESLLARPRVTLYLAWITQWFQVVPQNQFFFATLEEYAEDRVKVLNDICSFLEIGNLPQDVQKEIQQAEVRNCMTCSKVYKDMGPMNPETQEILQDFYRPYNHRLAQLLQNDKFNFTAKSKLQA